MLGERTTAAFKTNKMPKCQGRPEDGLCPDRKNDGSVHNTIADLFLCNACEDYRWPVLGAKPKKPKVKPAAPRRTTNVKSKKPSKTDIDTDKANDPVIECSTCLLPANSGDKNGLTCNICYGYYHLQCINANIPASDTDAEQIINIAKLIGWVCHECTVQSTTKLNDLQSAVNMLFEEVNKLKSTIAALETTPSVYTAQPSTLKSKKEMVSEVSLVVHQTLNDKARRRCNVVISGFPEPDEGDDDSNKLADRKSFVDLCEQYLEVKPSLSSKGCVRLGRHDQSKTTPRKLLVHLDSETSASDLLLSSRCLRRNSECANIYINPDLSPAESKIAYEQRKRRRDAAVSRAAAASNSVVNDCHQQFADLDASSSASNGISSLSINAAAYVPTNVQISTE